MLEIGEATVNRTLRLKRETGDVERRPRGGGNRSLIHDRIAQLLTAIVQDMPDATVAEIKHPEDGASILFEGIVRNHSRGRRTLFLEYEAYEPMALKELESLIAEAIRRFQIRDAAVIHRLGRLEIGETSVLIVVTSAHRAAAFEACRWIIDTLKKTVPIWKKEHFEDGAVWADGEPFPAEITSSGTVTNPQTPASK